MRNKLLEVKNLFSGYGEIDIIKDINLEIDEGEILAVVGPNGCGKTTLLKTLARLLPYKGSILLDEKEISLFPRKILSLKIALLSQNSGVYFPYSVYETISLGRYPHSQGFLKTLSGEDKKIINDVLLQLNLFNEKDKPLNELSGGQLQRVFLARSLVQNPDIILLDEPTNHLDLKNQIELLEHLSVWVKEKRRAVIAVLHDLNLAKYYADRICLLCRGLLVSSGKTESVFGKEILNEVYGMDIRSFMLKSLNNWTK